MSPTAGSFPPRGSARPGPDRDAGDHDPDDHDADEQVWRDEAPAVLGALLRRSGDLGRCEDAVAEALLAAARQWPVDGRPDRPRAWLIRVASRRLIDLERADRAREHRELATAVHERLDTAHHASAEDEAGGSPGVDDSLHLLVLCCHPALTPASQIALTLRAVGGLSTAQIAAGFLVPEATMAQRISRAKAAITAAGGRFDAIRAADLPGRVSAVRHVLYLIFNEGYAASAGPRVVDVDLVAEALRLTGMLHRAVPDDDETTGLLALMFLTHARTPARVTAGGDLVPLAEQDRSRWDDGAVRRGIALVERVLPHGPVGPFQLQAAVAAVHAEAPSADDTDWAQIVELYRMLERLTPTPLIRLNLAAAIGMAEGPDAGLAALAAVADAVTPTQRHRLLAARAHLLERRGDHAAAAAAYREAARTTRSIPEQRYLNRKATALGS